MVGSRSVVVVIEGFVGGGAERVVARLAESWVTRGETVHAITLKDESQDFFRVPAGVRRTVIGEPEGSHALGEMWRRVRALRREFKRHAGSTVVSFLTAMNVTTILASLWLPVRVVVCERSDPARPDLGRIWRTLRWLTYRMADSVTANSAGAVARMKAYVPPERLRLVPNPVPVATRIANPSESSTVLSVGRLEPVKDHALLVEGFIRLTKRVPGPRLEIVGEGPQRADIEALAKSAPHPGSVVVRGVTTEIEAHYRDAAIFVLTSRHEGTPNALLEAMAHGLPCIVPDNLPGALAYVEDGVSGVVFRAGDADDLARAIERLMTDPDARAKMGRAARERVSTESLDDVVATWDAVLWPHNGGS